MSSSGTNGESSHAVHTASVCGPGNKKHGMARPRVGAVVQARMGSTRLPGKMLMELLPGRTVIGYLLERLRICPDLDAVILATSVHGQDDPLAELAGRLGVPCFRGSESDCLERVHGACLANGVEVMARVTGDCPLVPPDVVSAMVRYFLANRDRLDYLSNRQFTDYPEGTDVEIFSADSLAQAAREASAPREREHINYFFLDRSDRFRIRYFNHAAGEDFSRFKLSIDTFADLERARALFTRHGLSPEFTLAGLLSTLTRLEDSPEVHP